MLHKQARRPASTILTIEFTDRPQRRAAHLGNQMGQVWSEAVSAPASGGFVALMPTRNAAGSSHASQHAGIFSIRPFSAPPSDGQLPVTFPAAALPKQRAQKLTFLNAAHLPHRPARAGGVEMDPLPSPLPSPPRCNSAVVSLRLCRGVTAHQRDRQKRRRVCFRTSDCSKK